MKHFSHYLLSVLAGTVLLLGGAIAYGFIYLEDLKAEVTSLKQEIANEEEQTRRLNLLRSNFDLVKEDQETLERYFFANTEEDWLRFVTSVEDLGGVAGVKSVITATDFDPKAPFSVTATFNGSKQAITQYIHLIDTFPAKMITKRFVLQEGQEGIWNGEIVLELLSIRKK